MLKDASGYNVVTCGAGSWYLVVVEGVHQGDEAAGLGLLVEVEAGNVPDEDGVEQPGQLQVVAGAQRLGSDTPHVNTAQDPEKPCFFGFPSVGIIH